MSSEKKVVQFHIFDPRNSIFKQGKQMKSEFKIARCSISDSCPLAKAGKCAALGGAFKSYCPSANVDRVEGFTRRARKFSSKIREWEERVAGEVSLQHEDSELYYTAEHVYLGFNWLSDGIEGKVKYFGNSKSYIEKGEFTTKLIHRMLSFRPMALMGGEIESYQKEIVPNFLKKLKEIDSKLYDELCAEHPEYLERTAEFNPVGKKAAILTLNPFDHIHVWGNGRYKDRIVWDGKLFTHYQVYTKSPVDGPKVDLSFEPTMEHYIKIENAAWVGPETKYK